MIINNFTKALLVLKYKHYMKMIKIENKKELLAFIKWKNNFKNIFQQYKANISKLFKFEIAVS